MFKLEGEIVGIQVLIVVPHRL